jgi:hypothetical protein
MHIKLTFIYGFISSKCMVYNMTYPFNVSIVICNFFDNILDSILLSRKKLKNNLKKI